MGQPDFESQTIDNPLRVNKVLSFLIYGTTAAEVEGLDHFPRDQWPSTLPLLFYSYHIMVGLGTWFERFRSSTRYQDLPASDIAFCVAAFADGMSEDRTGCALEDDYLEPSII